MSNRIDFFQSDQTQLSLPAPTVSILLDGMLCPWLEVMEIVRSGWPEFGWARLVYNPIAYSQAEQMLIDEIEAKLAIGKSVCIRQIYNATAPGISAFGLPVFVGQIEGLEKKLDNNGERVEITAKDFSAELKRITVYGQRVSDADGSTLFLAGSNTVFNENEKTNAATKSIVNK